MNDDSALLRRYAQDGSEQAFAELVSRHLGLVYHAALRQVGGDARRAEEVAQTVFIDLARKAAELARRPLLAGWLHTSTRYAAVNLHRAERRRQIREQEAFAMNETLQAHASDRAWEDLRPVIDDALHALGERDREAVLLRFFEGLPFAAIGTKLSLTEDAARVRVERALEKIRRMLVRRGVTSTSAALATVLISHAGAAAPVGLAAKISAATLVAGAGIGAGAAGLGLFALMTTSKTVALAGAIAALAVGIAVYQGVENKNSRASLAGAQKEQADLRAKVHDLEQQLAASAARVRAMEEESTTLLGALDEAAKAQAAPVKPVEPITLKTVAARFKRAQELATAGQGEEALQEYLWCYEDGFPRFTEYASSRLGLLVELIATLGKTYPPALKALRERRDQAERALQSGTDGIDITMTFAKINHALNEDARTLRYWEQLPLRERNRGLLGHEIYAQLLEARRYRDALQAVPYDSMSDTFNLSLNQKLPDLPKHPNFKQEWRISFVKKTADHIEVLAGAGDLEHARELAAKLLKYDNSPETQAALRQSLARAGQAQLLDNASP